jgi:hypothetical protein
MRITCVLLCTTLFLSAWAEVSAVPVRLRAGFAAGDESAGRNVTIRLDPQGAAEPSEPRVLQLSIPAEKVIDVPPGTWQLTAEGQDLWSAPVWIAPTPGQAEQTVTLRFLPASTLTGSLQSVSGQPIPSMIDLRLEASPGSAIKLPPVAVQCPVSEARFQCTVPVGKLDLRLRSATAIPIYFWDVEIQAGKAADAGLFKLKEGASVVGRVQTSDGKAVPGARIHLLPQVFGDPTDPAQSEGLKAMSLTAETNARGFFQLQEPAPGMFVVIAEKEDLAQTGRAGIEVRSGLEAQILDPLVLSKPLTLRLSLEPSLAPSGSPWHVILEQKAFADNMRPKGYRGDATVEGLWEQKGLNPGKYRLHLNDGRTAWRSEEIELSEESSTLHLSLQGLPVRGRVYLGDQPLEASLLLYGGSGNGQARVRSDEEGEFETLLSSEGRWNVEVSDSDNLKLRLDPIEIRKVPGQSYARVEIRIPDTFLQGVVVDEKRQAVPKADVQFFSHKRPLTKAVTDDKGRFEIRGIPPGDFYIYAQEGERQSEWLQTRVEEERDNPELELALRTRLRVQGRVFSSTGPVAGAQINAFASTPGTTFGGGDRTISGPAGEFTLKLTSGVEAAHLNILAPGYATRMLRLPLGQAPAFEIPLEPVGGTLIFDFGDRTVDQIRTGIGILAHGGSFVPLVGTLEWARTQRVPQSDPRRIVLPNMEAGEYLLCAGPESYVSIPLGMAPPPEQCSRGTLAPLGELVLSLPVPPETAAAASASP